ncbi:MAG: hypothetical protein ACI9Y7_002852 [Dokdonia sp.]|jgi:hypothetical protein
MKRILLFLSLGKNLCHTFTYDVIHFLCDYRMHNLEDVIFNNIMPVKSQRFNTKIYIFERYSTLRTLLIGINTSPFIYNKIVLKPVLQKK